jgi:hypothetical protein
MITRIKWTQTDGTEREHIRVSVCNLERPEDVEQLGRGLLQAAAEWRAEIEHRGPSGPPTFKTFAFNRCYDGSTQNIATWIEQPWALVRHGSGTAIAFLVRNLPLGGTSAWIVSAKFKNREHHWTCRYQTTHTVSSADILHVFPCALPWSPTLGDIESTREKVRRAA